MNNLQESFRESVRRGEVWSEERLLTKAQELRPALSAEELAQLQEWHRELSQWKYLWPYLADPQVREIIIHSPTDLQLQKKGRLEALTVQLPEHQDLQISFEIMALQSFAEWNFSRPFQSFFMAIQGMDLRVSLTHFSISPLGTSKIFIRKIQQEKLCFNDFACSQELSQLLLTMLKEKSNILLAGATGSGKTTLLSTLLGEIGPHEHVVVLEDTHEITLERPNFSYLVSEQNPREKRGIQDFCAYALRMRPDRIILGEMRSAESVPFLLSMNTGHKGLISTIHANGARDALGRVAFLFTLFSGVKNMDYELAVKLVCQNVDYVVYLEKLCVKEVVKVLGSERGVPYVENILGAS